MSEQTADPTSEEQSTEVDDTREPATQRDQTADVEPGRPEAPEHGVTGHGHPSEKQYVAIALILAAVTALEVGVYYITAIPKHLLTAMLLVMSVVKFSLVVLWFMHLRFDSRLFRRLFVTGLALALGVMTIFLSSLHFYNAHGQR